MRHDLHIIAINIFNRCAANNIGLEVQWIRRNELERADFISRIIDIDDWQISHSLFCYFDNIWDLHTVDCFANTIILKCLSFSPAIGTQDARG